MWRITLSLANHNIHLMIKRRSRIKIGMRGKDVKRAGLYQYVVVEHQEGEHSCRSPLKERGVLAAFGGSPAQESGVHKKFDCKNQWGF